MEKRKLVSAEQELMVFTEDDCNSPELKKHLYINSSKMYPKNLSPVKTAMTCKKTSPRGESTSNDNSTFIGLSSNDEERSFREVPSTTMEYLSLPRSTGTNTDDHKIQNVDSDTIATVSSGAFFSIISETDIVIPFTSNQNDFRPTTPPLFHEWLAQLLNNELMLVVCSFYFHVSQTVR